MTTVASGESGAASLVADLTALYWTTAAGDIRKRDNLPGATARTLVSGAGAAFTSPRVQALAITSLYVVWITNDGRVMRAPK